MKVLNMQKFTITIPEELVPYLTEQYKTPEAYIEAVLLTPLVNKYRQEKLKKRIKEWENDTNAEIKPVVDQIKVKKRDETPEPEPVEETPTEEPEEDTSTDTSIDTTIDTTTKALQVVEKPTKNVNNEVAETASKVKKNKTFDQIGN